MHDLNYVLTKEQQLKLSTVLKEYLNVNDWKGLFAQTNCEEFAQQHTQFYKDVSWENETLEQDCADALAFMLDKDSSNLKVIWDLPGVQAMTKRKDENFYTEIEALVEYANNQSNALTASDLPNDNLNPYKALEDAESLLDSNGTNEAYALAHAALHNFLQQACTNKEISTDKSDSISLLHAKINDHLKQQNEINQNDKSLAMLRTTTLITEIIDDLKHQNQNDRAFTQADVKFAINLSRSVMVYIDELIG